MFVDCISVASVVVEAASRPRHLRAWQMQKAAAAYRSCIPQAREATTNRMKWELITGVSPARRTDGVLVLRSESAAPTRPYAVGLVESSVRVQATVDVLRVPRLQT